MNVWLSIIIPVYNGEKYITSAIKSIVTQDTTGIEIIIIDDGSTDRSYDVCEQLARKYKQIKLIHSENKGVSHARNLGIKEAKGKWITFLDSDDYLLESAIATMKESVSENENLIIFNYCKDEIITLNREKETIKLERENSLNVLLDFTKYRELLPPNMRMKHSVFTSCWAKLYRKSIIETHKIAFQETLTLSEDMCFNLECFNTISSVTIIDHEVYNYSNNPESVTHSFSEKKLFARQQLISYLMQKKDLPKECDLAKHKYMILTVLQLAEKVGNINDAEIRKKYVLFLRKIYIAECVLDKIDKCFSTGRKRNYYLKIQYWMFRHKIYNLMPLIGSIYEKVRG